MVNLYTSALVEPVNDLVEILVAELTLDPSIDLVVSKYSSAEEFIAVIIPSIAYVENDDGSNTHFRVYFNSGQISSGEKIKIELDNNV